MQRNHEKEKLEKARQSVRLHAHCTPNCFCLYCDLDKSVSKKHTWTELIGLLGLPNIHGTPGEELNAEVSYLD